MCESGIKLATGIHERRLRALAERRRGNAAHHSGLERTLWESTYQETTKHHQGLGRCARNFAFLAPAFQAGVQIVLSIQIDQYVMSDDGMTVAPTEKCPRNWAQSDGNERAGRLAVFVSERLKRENS